MSVPVFDVRREFQGSFTARRTSTRFIAVHHAAALYPSAAGIDDVRSVARYHTQTRGWPGIGYHWCLAEITTGGPIGLYRCSDLDTQRAHVAYRNHEAVGVSCLTNFDVHPGGIPEPRWLEALTEAVGLLRAEYPDAQVVGHRDIALGPASPDGRDYRTACPGRMWPTWRARLLATPAPEADPYTEDAPILAAPRATLAQVTAYLLARTTGDYSDYDVAQVIVPAYWRTATEAGVDPVLAIAQMLHETGNLTSFWASRPQRNPAGIGVTGQAQTTRPTGGAWAFNPQRGRWEAGVSFRDWVAESIPAHVGRLRAYASAEPHPLVGVALRYRALPPAARGSAPTLKPLGTIHNASGFGWAMPGRTYGASIARIAEMMRGSL